MQSWERAAFVPNSVFLGYTLVYTDHLKATKKTTKKAAIFYRNCLFSSGATGFELRSSRANTI